MSGGPLGAGPVRPLPQPGAVIFRHHQAGTSFISRPSRPEGWQEAVVTLVCVHSTSLLLPLVVPRPTCGRLRPLSAAVRPPHCSSRSSSGPAKREARRRLGHWRSSAPGKGRLPVHSPETARPGLHPCCTGKGHGRWRPGPFSRSPGRSRYVASSWCILSRSHSDALAAPA